MTILVTGANGFVGAALCNRLFRESQPFIAAVRAHLSTPYPANTVAVGEICQKTDWQVALSNIQQVVHLAARVHIMHERCNDPLGEFRRVNVEGTVALAKQAAASGVKRFIFVSSIKVNGESTASGRPFCADSFASPQDPYAQSKHEAEEALWSIAAETGMEVVIIRPPLVYGHGVKGNFGAMMRWLALGVPLPLAGVTENRRSLVALDNLVDLILMCLNHSAAANQTFLVSDDQDLSTSDLLFKMAHAQGKSARLFYFPLTILKLAATLVGRRSVYHRLCGSLQIDIQKTKQMLDWTPPLSVDEGMLRAYRNCAGNGCVGS